MNRSPTAMRTSSPEPAGSVLGRGTRVRGRVHGDGDLRIEGQIEGNVSVTGDLTIDEGGSMAGQIEAESVTILGALQGDVVARGPVAIRSTAKVTGHMGGAEVSLEEGAEFSGRIEAEFDLPAELSARPAGR